MAKRVDWERLIEAHADRAFSFALGLSGNPEDAKELVQEAFAKVLALADRLDGRPFEAWFLTVLKNIYLDGARSYERRHGVSLDIEVGPEGLSVAEAVADARDEALLSRLERQETAALVRRALGELSPRLKGALLLIDLQGVSYEQAAKVLDCQPGTLRSRLTRARQALRDKLISLEVAPS